MYSFVLQDWISATVNVNLVGITQSECDWMSFQAYQDVIFYTEVKACDFGGGEDLLLKLQTSPSKDESMFKDMIEIGLVAGTTTVSKVITSANPSVPLSRWVRWELRVAGTPATDYSATFRVLVSANAVGPL